MIDFSISELVSDTEGMNWLEGFLHPNGFVCPHCGSAERRLLREQGAFPAYGCLARDGYYTLSSDNDRPPIISVICRESGAVRYWVVEHTDKATRRQIIGASIPLEATLLFTDEANNYTGLHAAPSTVCHAQHEWARDDDGDGLREVHCSPLALLGAALRTYLRAFRGVHKYYLAEFVATFETLLNAKAIAPALIQRLGFGIRSHANDS